LGRKHKAPDCGVEAEGKGAQRRCLVCRKELDRDDSVRFVLGPDGEPGIDWKRRLPGRGASVCWSREGLQAVGEPGVLSRAFKQNVRVPHPGWALDAARAEVARRQREFLGLAARAGELKSGGNVVRRCLSSGWATAIVLAAEVGATVQSDWERRAAGLEVPVYRSVLGPEAIAVALGKGGLRSVLALGPGPVAAALTRELIRGDRLL
jgi:predicted RNA-binding protein YlxR (DUF448 family)